jgi:hypothetical protein
MPNFSGWMESSIEQDLVEDGGSDEVGGGDQGILFVGETNVDLGGSFHGGGGSFRLKGWQGAVCLGRRGRVDRESAECRM